MSRGPAISPHTRAINMSAMNTAALPMSLARFESELCSKEMRSMATSTRAHRVAGLLRYRDVKSRQGSYWHRGGEQPLLGMTIPERFAEIVNRFPEREAVVSAPQRRRLTYAQLARAIDELASALIGLGFARGERIGVWSTNNVEWLLLQFATARIGAILVNINPANRTREPKGAISPSISARAGPSPTSRARHFRSVSRAKARASTR